MRKYSNVGTTGMLLNQRMTRYSMKYYNQYILIDKKPLNNQYKKWIDSGILYIKDIFNANGNVLSVQELCVKYNININLMLYNSITRAIPKHWRVYINNHPPSSEVSQFLHNECIMIDGEPKCIASVSSKYVSQLIIKRIQKPPISIERWIDKFPFLNDKDFRMFFKLAHTAVTESKLHCFQYKILNRILPCNESLYRMKIKSSPKCDVCTETESLEHLLYLCNYTKQFWVTLSNWINTCLNMSITLSEVNVLFGIHGNKEENRVLNFVIMQAKWYIYKSKIKEEIIFLLAFFTQLKYNAQIEYLIEKMKMKEENVENIWAKLYSAI